jgi:hypothetical protein
MAKKMILLIVLSLAAGLSHEAPPATVHSIELPQIYTELKAGYGREKVEALCGICHSLDYIAMQPQFSRAQWTAVVNKMIKVMGAPISEDDAGIIVNYLVKDYGQGIRR